MPANRAPEVTLVAPAWTRLLGFAGSAAFVALGDCLITRPTGHDVFGLQAVLAGWLSIVVFGAFGLLSAIQLIPGFRDRLILTEDGFAASTLLRLKHHAWTDIVGGFAVWQLRRTKCVVFNTARGQRTLSRAISGYNGYLPAHLGISAESLAALMNRHLAAARARAASSPPRYADMPPHADTPRPFGREGVQ